MAHKLKVLIASAWLNSEREYDIAVWKKRQTLLSLTAFMTEHFGLRFLKANIPDLEILEYPTKEQYLEKLKEGWDVVGVSFYINESNDALLMAEAARKAGVPTIWGGNYGVLTPEVASAFDRVFTGWSESAIADELELRHEHLIHPEIYLKIAYKGVPVQTWGIMFSSRGCNEACNFCQTPRFYRKPYPIDLSSLNAVAQKYRAAGVGQVIILDENFGHFEHHANSVIDMLASYDLRWNPLTRVETIAQNYDHWLASGLAGASLGVESLNQNSLDNASKGIDAKQTRELLARMSRDNLLSQVFYIIGFPQDTEKSIRSDIMELKNFGIDSPQIQILTPYPTTRLYKQIELDYGISDRNLAHYDSTWMVWNHPHIAPERMREILFWANRELYNFGVTARTARKFVVQNIQRTLRHSRRKLSPFRSTIKQGVS